MDDPLLTNAKYSPGKAGLILNIIFLLASLLAVFYFFKPNIQFILILTIYCAFSAIFTILLYIGKVWLIKVYLLKNSERYSSRPALLLFLVLLILSFIILFLIPNLWLIFMCGVVAGLSLSELAIYFRYKKIKSENQK